MKNTKKLWLIAIIMIGMAFVLGACDPDPDPENGPGNGPGGSTTPAAPANLKADVITDNSITISWDAVTGATGYRVYRATSTTNTPGAFSHVGTRGANETSFANTSGLSANRNYWYQVVALNGSLRSEPSEPLQVRTETAEVPPAPATAPGNLTLATTQDTASITLTWGTVTGATQYQIERSSVSATSGFAFLTSATTPILNHSTGMTVGTRYFFRVRATNRGGNGPWSSVISIIAGQPGSHQTN